MKNYIVISLYLLFTILLAGCSREEPVVGPHLPAEGGVVQVPLSFDMEYDGDEDPYMGNSNSPETKAPATGIVDNAVRDVWILQFSGTTDDSPLVSPPQYLEGTALSGSISLVGSEGATHLIAAVANTAERGFQWNLTPGKSTLADFKRSHRTLNGEFGTYLGKRIMMSGKCETVVSSSTTLNFLMRRNLAKLQFNLINNSGASNITITGVQIYNVPERVYAFAGQLDQSAIFPAVEENFIEYHTEQNINIVAGSNQSFVWYLPQNQRGKSKSPNTDPNDKNIYAPENATYIRIRARYPDSGEDVVLAYKIYPGANMHDDFNIIPNKRYTLDITINSTGDPTVDTRIEDYSLVDLKGKAANTYILNIPPSDLNTKRRYRIYPDQVNTYWGGNGYEMLGNVHIGSIANGNARYWAVDVIWMTKKGLVTRNSVTDGNVKIITYPDARGEESYFDVEVPKTAMMGNFTVGIFHNTDRNGVKDIDEPYIWSWQFWVTDYNPDAKVTIRETGNTLTAQYVYPVPGGQVERYAGTEWSSTTGIYRNAVMMDRALGAVGKYPTNQTNDILRYQYGRKDPFPYLVNQAFDIDGNSLPSYTTSARPGGLGSDVDIQESIAEPFTFFKVSGNAGGDWTNSNENLPPFMLWKDKNITGGRVELQKNTQKSLFDPCPYGWQIPTPLAWDDFKYGRTVAASARPETAFQYNGGMALRYWPGQETDPVGGDINYQLTHGYIRESNATNYSPADHMYATSTPNTASSRIVFHFTNAIGYISNQTILTRAAATPVRCVKISVQ